MRRVLSELRVPVVQAPMAGVTTTKMVNAASRAGVMGSIAGSFMKPSALSSAIDEVIEQSGKKPFAVNLFAIEPLDMSTHRNQERIASSRKSIAKYYEELNLEQPSELTLPPTFAEQIEVVLEKKVPVFSFCFGTVNSDLMSRLKKNGTYVVGTATCIEEARLLEASGVDAIIAQGSDAGGHRGGFLDHTPLIGTFSLVPQVVDAVSVPVIAAGGIMDGRGVKAALALGATAVQMGTAFLTSAESEANNLHKRSILSVQDSTTTVSRIWSGRPARGLENSFSHKYVNSDATVAPYPAMQALTNPLKAASLKRNRTDLASMWCGQAPLLAKDCAIEDIVSEIHSSLK